MNKLCTNSTTLASSKLENDRMLHFCSTVIMHVFQLEKFYSKEIVMCTGGVSVY